MGRILKTTYRLHGAGMRGCEKREMTAKELAEQLDGKVRGNETSLSDCIIAAKIRAGSCLLHDG